MIGSCDCTRVYIPGQSLAALKHFYREHGKKLWGTMGFHDAFNLSRNWFASSYLAIDQGPIILMIENHRTKLLWNNFMNNTDIRAGVEKINNLMKITAIDDQPLSNQIKVYPNPAGNSEIKIQLPLNVKIYYLYAMDGRKMTVHIVSSVIADQMKEVVLSLENIIAGAYTLTFSTNGKYYSKKVMVQ